MRAAKSFKKKLEKTNFRRVIISFNNKKLPEKKNLLAEAAENY